MRLIDADNLEQDTEWDIYDDGFMSYSQIAIECAETFEIEDMIKEIKAQKIDNAYPSSKDEKYNEGIDAVLQIIKKYITEFQEERIYY